MKKIYFFIIFTSMVFNAWAQLPPVANFNASNTIICDSSCIYFTDMSTNSPTSWRWTFSGAIPSSSTLQNPQNICYNATGNFSVKLWVSNSSGADSGYKNITVAPWPPTPVLKCSNDTLFVLNDSAYVGLQWFADTTIIHGATSSYLVVINAGSYKVYGFNLYGCVAFSSIVTCGVGINNFSESDLINIYPDPATNQIIIHGRLKPDVSAAASIMDLVGRDVLCFNLEREDEAIDISALRAGIYFIRISTPGENFVKRFIKE